MQSLKTAAIVVLVMSVTYGIWGPLTTPPEELPPEVAEMLVVSDDLGIDTGLPESLESIANGQGIPLGGDEIPPLSVASSTTASVSMNDSGVTYGSSFADLEPAPTKQNSIYSGATANASGASAYGAPQKLPAATGGPVGYAASAGNDYPSTGNRFHLPDPSAASTTFSADTGTRFQPESELTEIPKDGSVSLSSGTTAADMIVPPAAPATPPDTRPVQTPNVGLQNAIMTADRQYSSDQKKEALATLSLFYNTPDVSPSQRSELLSRLDPLAREVIYSTNHLLEEPHRVGVNETLMEVAERYEVPWQLLANINQIRDPVTVLPGTELKVLRGPFNAQVDLQRNELTLFLGDLYAGRFPIGVGSDPKPTPGTFTVQDKQSSHTFYDPSGTPVPAGSPDNPYGSMWVDLGGRLCIHGSPNTMQPSTKGCISLADDHASDLYGILTQGSLITIRR